MGAAKAWEEEQWARGFNYVADKHVCGACVDDEALRDHIREHAVATTCDYCGRSAAEPIACELDDFNAAIAGGIRVEWDDAINFMPYDGGDWALPDVNRSIHDLLFDDFQLELHEDLFNDVVTAFIDRSFAPRYYFDVAPDERLRFGWETFVHQVTHHTRYLFLRPNADSDADSRDIQPAEMLSEIGRVVAETGLVHELPSGTTLFRGRLYQRAEGDPPATAAALGTVPQDRATRSNRMSPNGIPMFYGAFDEETAVDETVVPGREPGEDLTVAEFTTGETYQVVDLTDLPHVPTVFEVERREIRPWLLFLHQFSDEVSKPVDHAQREHLEYVPTQIVTEYFRHAFESEYGARVDGLLYRSASREDGRCVVLFVENDRCRDPGPTGHAADGLVLTGAWCEVPTT
jgi:hypothetical protein